MIITIHQFLRVYNHIKFDLHNSQSEFSLLDRKVKIKNLKLKSLKRIYI